MSCLDIFLALFDYSVAVSNEKLQEPEGWAARSG
jgi:hypothetical protein